MVKINNWFLCSCPVGSMTSKVVGNQIVTEMWISVGVLLFARRKFGNSMRSLLFRTFPEYFCAAHNFIHVVQLLNDQGMQGNSRCFGDCSVLWFCTGYRCTSYTLCWQREAEGFGNVKQRKHIRLTEEEVISEHQISDFTVEIMLYL